MAEGGQDVAERRRLGAAQRSLRLAAGMTLDETSKAFGMTIQGYRRFETGEAQSIHQPSQLERLARAVGRSREELLMRAAAMQAEGATAQVTVLADRRSWETGEPGAAPLPFRGRIRPGAWFDVGDLTRVTARDHSLTRDRRFPNADQFVKEFEGDSMVAAQLGDGDLVHLVSTADIGYWPTDGHLVEVERLRAEGRERETSIRMVQVTRDGVLLWSRPAARDLAEAIALPDGPIAAENAEVRIVARVLASVRRFD